MSTTVTKYAQSNQVVTTGWTNPTYAYADDTNYATAAPAKNSSVVTEYYNFDFQIPTGATINSITVYGMYQVDTTISIATFRMYTYKGATAVGTEYTDTTEPLSLTERTNTNNGTWTVAELNLNTTSGMLIRVTGQRGSDNDAVTFSLDYIKVAINYSTRTSKTLTSTATNATASMTRKLALSKTLSAVSNITATNPTRTETDGGYHIERKTGAGGSYAEIAIDDASPYQDNGPPFVDGTTYYYRVRRYTGGAYTDYSNVVDVTYTEGGAQTKSLSATVNASASRPSKIKRNIIESVSVAGKRTAEIANKIASAYVNAAADLIRDIKREMAAHATATASSDRKIKNRLIAVSNVASSIKRKTANKLIAITSVLGTAARKSALSKTLTATANTINTLTRATRRKIAATANANASMVRQIVSIVRKAISATTAATATIGRAIGNNIKTTVNLSGDTTRKVANILKATATASATVKRRVKNILKATATAAASMTRDFTNIIQKALTATVNAGATVKRDMSNILVSSVAQSAAITRQTANIIAATISVSGSAIRQTARTMAKAVSITASVVRESVVLYFKTLAASATTTAALTRTAKTVKAAAIAASAAKSIIVYKITTGIVNPTATAMRFITHHFAATVANITATIVKAKPLTLWADVDTFGTMRKKIGNKVKATPKTYGTIGRAISKSFSGITEASGAAIRHTARTIATATIKATGTIKRKTRNMLSATTTAGGAIIRQIGQTKIAHAVIGGIVAATPDWFSYFVLQRKVGAGGTWETLTNLPSNDFEHIDTGGFINDTYYYYRVKKVVGALESAWSNEEYLFYHTDTLINYKTLATVIKISGTRNGGIGKFEIAIVDINGNRITTVRRHNSAVVETIESIARKVSTTKVAAAISDVAATAGRQISKTAAALTTITASWLRGVSHFYRTFAASIATTGTATRKATKTMSAALTGAGIGIGRKIISTKTAVTNAAVLGVKRAITVTKTASVSSPSRVVRGIGKAFAILIEAIARPLFFKHGNTVELTAVYDVSESLTAIYTFNDSVTAIFTFNEEVAYQMGSETIGETIYMVVGETKVINLTVTDENGDPAVLTGASAKFAIDNLVEKTCVINSNVITATLTPADGLRVGTFEYEFRVKDISGQEDSLTMGSIVVKKNRVVTPMS